jgi:hypothetical protein
MDAGLLALMRRVGVNNCGRCACLNVAASRWDDCRDTLQLRVHLAAVPIQSELGGRECDDRAERREVWVVVRDLVQRKRDQELVRLKRILALRLLVLLRCMSKAR